MNVREKLRAFTAMEAELRRIPQERLRGMTPAEIATVVRRVRGATQAINEHNKLTGGDLLRNSSAENIRNAIRSQYEQLLRQAGGSND